MEVFENEMRARATDSIGQMMIFEIVDLPKERITTINEKVLAIISTFPEFSPWKIHMTLGIILFLTYGNLRGVKEAGKAFALPTYLFVGSMFTVFIIGIYREISGTLPILDINQPGVVDKIS